MPPAVFLLDNKATIMRLSVIVCTRNRAYALGECLDSITASLSHASPVEAEFVVVDNGSTDDTFATLNSWAKTSSFPVRLVFEPRTGLAVARNRGVRTARGELLVFTDDDCRLSKEYVSELLRYDANDGSEMVMRGGRVELGDPTDLPLTIKSRPAAVRWNRKMNSARHENLGDTLLGCNMAMRRTATDLLGPFDERFGAGSRIPGGEDTDYILRAYLADITIEAVPDMAVFHYHGRKKIDEGKKLFRNYSIGTGALFAKYMFRAPQLCRPLYWDVKNTCKETVAGKNTFMPSMDFSHKDKLSHYVVGMARYYLATARFYLRGLWRHDDHAG
jgi:glycosyltransferase involved in cell wall biosynthesis